SLLLSHLSSLFFLSESVHHLVLHSFPTRRSSDLKSDPHWRSFQSVDPPGVKDVIPFCSKRHRPKQQLISWPKSQSPRYGQSIQIDRKSTRLNSSHVSISYAVFCLKKKKKTQIIK